MNQIGSPFNGQEIKSSDDFDFQMANLTFDQHNIHNHFSNLGGSLGGISPPKSISNPSNNVLSDRSTNSSSSNNDIRLSMPAPKRTLPTNIIDNLNDDSLFYSAHQHHSFGNANSPYSSTEPVPNIDTIFKNRKEGESFDSSRGPRSFSLGDDFCPPPSGDQIYNRPASTPIHDSFSSVNGSFYQNGNIGTNGIYHGQRQIDSFNSTLQRFQQQNDQDSRHQQGYIQSQNTPSNLQSHLADIDRRMQIRRGKSGQNLQNYDSGPMSPMMPAPQATRQHPFLTARNGLPIATFRPESNLHHSSALQRPASTPLPNHHMHHMHQQTHQQSVIPQNNVPNLYTHIYLCVYI